MAAPKGNQYAKGRTMPIEQVEVRKLTRARLEAILHKYLDSKADDLKAILKTPGDLPMIELMVVSVMSKSASLGDQNRMDYLLSRLLGKVPDRVEFEDKTDQNEIERLKSEYKAIMKKP